MKIFLLALALLTAFGLPLIAADKAKPTPPKGVRNVGVEEFDKLRADKNAVVLDVRTEDEFKAGHIPGAVNLDYLSSDFQRKAAKLDKSKTYLVHCASGRRSVGASDVLTKAAFTNVVNLEPGFNGWEKAGKPVEKK
jgi:phage shock protein E